jgi:hypothetical protein
LRLALGRGFLLLLLLLNTLWLLVVVGVAMEPPLAVAEQAGLELHRVLLFLQVLQLQLL